MAENYAGYSGKENLPRRGFRFTERDFPTPMYTLLA